RSRDGPVPDPQPPRRSPRRRRYAADARQRDASDQPAADSVGGADGGAGDADHSARLPAGGVYPPLDPSRLDGALLVRLQPPVRGPQSAAREDVLRAQAPLDPD